MQHDPEIESFKIYDKQVRETIDQMSFEINQPYPHVQQVSLMESMKKHWQGLTLFVDNPQIPMDNNIAEQMLRGPVLGRKNYWGNHALWAGQLSAAMFSIIQTCACNNISPRAYLSWYLSECVKKGTAPSEDEIDCFLPHKLSPDIRKRLQFHYKRVCTSEEPAFPC
ncbi:MAG: IS66 family transposase [Candidatus Ratteibacteria bacterium]